MGDTIKKLSVGLILLLAGFVSGVRCEDYQTQVVGPFGTLNNYDSSISLPADKSQDLLNVDISPGGRSVKKRPGYSTAYTLGITTSPTHGVYRFYDSSGNEVFLFFNDTRLSTSVNGTSPRVLMSSGTSAATYQCVDYAGQAYCANTSRTNIIKTDGSTWSALTGLVSTGTIIAVTPDRLIESGFTEAPNRIDFSASALFTSWAQPFLLSTDPNEITITAPGSRITHLVYAFQRLMWFKDSSFGYVLFDNNSLSNWVVKTVSPNVGTLDNSSIYWQDVLYFRGQDGHFYSYDGATVQRMSRDISTSINLAQSRRSASWSQTSAADWNSGTYDDTVYVDTTTTAGTLQTLYPDQFNSLRSNVWTTWANGASSINLISTSGGQLVLHGTNSGTTNDIGMRTLSKARTVVDPGIQWYFEVKSMEDNSGNNVLVYFILSDTATANTFTARDTSNRIYFNITSTDSTKNNDFRVGQVTAKEGVTTRILSSAISGQFTGTVPVQFTLTSSTYSLYANGILVSSGTLGGFTSTKQWYAYLGLVTQSSTDVGLHIDNFNVTPETFTYVSPVNNAPNITTWDSFSPTKVDGGGSHTFSIRASTNSFTVSSATPSWTTVTAGNVPTISTGSYFQIRDAFNLSDGTNSNPVALNDFTQNWFEGTAGDKVYGQYFDYGLWWNVQLGGGSTYNNYVLKFDLINNGWLIYDIPMNGMFVRSNSLYFGSSVGGYVYKYGDAQNDNGSAINAYWRSKDYFGDSPFTSKSITEISAAATSKPNSTLTLTTTVDNRYSLTDTWPLYNPYSNFIKYNNCQPLTAIGTTFNFMFGNNAADQPFEVFAGAVGYRPKPIKDTKQ